MEENNWNNLSKFLNDGKTFLEKICKKIPEACINFNVFNYTSTSTIISNNKHIFSEIFKFWQQKINLLTQPHRRTKRAYNRYCYTDNEDNCMNDIDLVNFIFLLYLEFYIALIIVLYLYLRPYF